MSDFKRRGETLDETINRMSGGRSASSPQPTAIERLTAAHARGDTSVGTAVRAVQAESGIAGTPKLTNVEKRKIRRLKK